MCEWFVKDGVSHQCVFTVYVLLCSLGMESQLLIHTTCRKLTDSCLALPQGAPTGSACKPGLSPSCLPGHVWQLMTLHAIARLALAIHNWHYC